MADPTAAYEVAAAQEAREAAAHRMMIAARKRVSITVTR
jgi:hypothetical protein